jgi:hypothetical protein
VAATSLSELPSNTSTFNQNLAKKNSSSLLKNVSNTPGVTTTLKDTVTVEKILIENPVNTDTLKELLTTSNETLQDSKNSSTLNTTVLEEVFGNNTNVTNTNTSNIITNLTTASTGGTTPIGDTTPLAPDVLDRLKEGTREIEDQSTTVNDDPNANNPPRIGQTVENEVVQSLWVNIAMPAMLLFGTIVSSAESLKNQSLLFAGIVFSLYTIGYDLTLHNFLISGIASQFIFLGINFMNCFQYVKENYPDDTIINKIRKANAMLINSGMENVKSKLLFVKKNFITGVSNPYLKLYVAAA